MIPPNFIPIDAAPPDTVLSVCWASGDGKVEYGSAAFVGSDPLTAQWYQKHLRNAPPECARPDGVLDDSSPGEDAGLYIDTKGEVPFIRGQRSMLMRLAIKYASRSYMPSGRLLGMGVRAFSHTDLVCILNEAKTIAAGYRNRRVETDLTVGTKCDTCTAPATRVMNSDTTTQCAWWYVAVYCEECFTKVVAEMEIYNKQYGT